MVYGQVENNKHIRVDNVAVDIDRTSNYIQIVRQKHKT